MTPASQLIAIRALEAALGVRVVDGRMEESGGAFFWDRHMVLPDDAASKCMEADCWRWLNRDESTSKEWLDLHHEMIDRDETSPIAATLRRLEALRKEKER